jgi:hypothetical protein
MDDTKDAGVKRKVEEMLAAALENGDGEAPGSESMPQLAPADVHVLLADDEKISRLVTSKLLRLCVLLISPSLATTPPT